MNVRVALIAGVLVGLAVGAAALLAGDGEEVLFRSLTADETDVVVFMEPQAPASAIGELRARLGDDDRISGVDYVTQDEAYDLFVCLFGASHFADRVTPDVLPPSFRLALDNRSDAALVVATYQEHSLVREVEEFPEWRANLDESATTATDCIE